jgi:hypothetical protein
VSDTVKTALVIGGAAIVGYFLVQKLIPPPALVKKTGTKATSPTTSISLGGLINTGLSALGGLVSTKRSNDLADSTAASDTLTGVVGFGGWDANSLADSTAAADSAAGVVGFGGWD